MRGRLVFGVLASAIVLCGGARAEKPGPGAQPSVPTSGASLDLYIKVKNQDLAEYCKTEQLGVPRCNPGKMYEAKDACAPPYKVAAVSCGLSDLGSEPHLVVSGADAKQVSGSCVWTFEKFPAEKAPQATTSLLCIK